MVTAIIAAAGQGKRMSRGINKLFIPLNGKPILLHTLQTVCRCTQVSAIVIVTASDEVADIHKILQTAGLTKPCAVVVGGSERQYSIANALATISPNTKYIMVHDGARPLCSVADLEATIAACFKYGAAGIAVRVKDTIKITDAEGFITCTPARESLWAIQTPQVFGAALLRRAYDQADQEGYLGTDDASLVERIGVRVKLVEGNYRNIKITTPEDLVIAKAFLRQEGEEAMRIGMGYDVHQLVIDRPLILGGVEVPHTLGLAGHSDADVLLHAICDALLGAASLGDIGRHFPDTDESYRGISSLFLLQKVKDLVKAQGFVTNNIDATIVAQKPKLSSYIPVMNEKIAAILGLPVEKVNVKATTTEGLGFAGRMEGIAAYAVVSITEYLS